MIIICFSCKAHFSTSKTPPYFDTLMAWLNQSKCYRALCFKVEKVLEKVGSEKVIVFESCPESVLDEVWLGRRRSRYRAATVVGAGWWTGQNWARVVHRILLKSQVGLLSTVNIYCLIFLGKSNWSTWALEVKEPSLARTLNSRVPFRHLQDTVCLFW